VEVAPAAMTMILTCQSRIVKCYHSRRAGPDEQLAKRQNDAVPKSLPIAVPTPVNVYEATQAFGSELRVHLIHFYAENPGRQVDAVRALGVERAVVSLNTRALLDVGVLVQSEDRAYSVDRGRFRELIEALEGFGPDDQ